jgi:hypothetical protein
MINIPNNKQWVQTNRSDVLGSLVGSFNLDLTTALTKTRVTRMLRTTGSIVGFTAPYAFKYLPSAGVIYVMAGTRVFQTNGTVSTPLLIDTYVVNGSSGFVSVTANIIYNDMEVFNGALYLTSGGVSAATLYRSNDGTAVSMGTYGSTGPYMLCAYGSRLYLSAVASSVPVVYSMSTGESIATSSTYTLTTLTKGEVITFMRASSNRIWIGTVNSNNGKGHVYEWDGVSTQVTASYRLESQGALACVIKDDIPWIVDTNGRLLVFNTRAFTEVARLPIDNKYLTNATSSTNSRFIHPNGISLINGRVNFLISNLMSDSASSIKEFCPSGVWEYDENIGLYHKYSLSYTTIGSNTITDYGQNRISVAGALTEMKINDTSAKMTGYFLAGADIYTDASSTVGAVFINDTFDEVSGTTGQYATQGYGYLVTTKIESKGAQDSWQKIFLRYKKLLTSSDFMVAKYRTSDPEPTAISLTWVTTTTFTTTTDLSALVGYEVEITQGVGSGQTAHITRVTGSGTFTVTLDQIITGATGTAKARVQNWTKMGIINDQTSQVKDFPINKTGASPWIQFKVCMALTGRGELNDLLVVNSNYQPAQ